jgi:hypothetical protein
LAQRDGRGTGEERHDEGASRGTHRGGRHIATCVARVGLCRRTDVAVTGEKCRLQFGTTFDDKRLAFPSAFLHLVFERLTLAKKSYGQLPCASAEDELLLIEVGKKTPGDDEAG